MKTNWNCLSKRLAGIAHAYLAALVAAIPCVAPMTGEAATAPRLCVLVPHFKDSYWLTVAQGIEDRAGDLGAAVQFREAGGYRARETQIAQIATCERLGVDAILIGAVSADHPALLSAVAAAAENRPVIGLVNELRSEALAARIGVDWREMGEVLGRHLADVHPAGTETRQAILLSGPAESGWVGPLEAGLTDGLSGSAIEIVAVYRADTGLRQQLRLLEQAISEWPNIDLVIGDAPAIEAAMALNATPALAATYLSHGIARGLLGGQVLAAPFDDPAEQGRMAVDAALAAVAGQVATELRGPRITLVTQDSAARLVRMSPAGYFPVLE
ncbi:TMAO reductase system periplasmic protein TorT [Cereibacter sphaeroides f. sp. denitrificans]